MVKQKPKRFILRVIPQPTATALTKTIIVIGVLLTKKIKTSFTFQRIERDVRESPKFQDRRIYQDDLVITKFQDEVDTTQAKNLLFSTNASRSAFTVLNFLNTNGFDPRNQTAVSGGHHKNCVLDSLEVESGIIGVFNCDLSIEFYRFSSGLISLDFYGRIPRKEYGFTVGNCSNIAITTPIPYVSFLACEDSDKQTLHIFEILGMSFNKIGQIKAMNVNLLSGVFLHEEQKKTFLVVAKKVEKNVTKATIFLSEYSPKNRINQNLTQRNSIFFTKKQIDFQSNLKTQQTDNTIFYSVNYIYMNNMIHLLLATKTRLSLKYNNMIAIKISSLTNLRLQPQLTEYPSFKMLVFFSHDPETSLDLVPIQLGQQNDPEGKMKRGFAVRDYKSLKWMFCKVKNQTMGAKCKVDNVYDIEIEKGPREIIRVYLGWDKGFILVNKILRSKQFFCSFKKDSKFPYMVLTDVDGCLLARSSQLVYLNQTKIYRREAFRRIQNTTIMMDTSKLEKRSLPEITFKDYRFGSLRNEVSFLPNATFVNNRFEGLKVEIINKRIAV